MATPPPYVSFVSVDAIHIAHLDRATGKRLIAEGLPVNMGWLFYGQIPIERAQPDGRSSNDEDEKMMKLARLDIPFAADYKQGMDPVGMMLNLIERDRYVGTFKQIVWSGPGSWKITTLPGPAQE
ncbi:MAG: hypothetical protein JNN20_16560 [Betaproteobacteria bacterium]|nr:hypothetical protein [Betaproteobacteria bacterium]